MTTTKTRKLGSLQSTVLAMMARKQYQCGADSKLARCLDSLVVRGYLSRSTVVDNFGRTVPEWRFVKS